MHWNDVPKDSVTRVMIVDDHELVRDGLRQLIDRQRHLKVCGEAGSERQARDQIKSLKPELVIVDLTLHESSGLDLIKWMQQTGQESKVIVSTMREERDYGERAFRAGAVGYVNKQEPANVVLTAIDRVLQGRFFFSDAMSERIMRLALSGSTLQEDSPVSNLSDRELEIFTLIGQGCTTDEIASRLYLSANTVGTYRERLKNKLNLKTAAELAHYAILWTTEQG